MESNDGFMLHTTHAGDKRKLTAILYCNDGWRPEDGGELMMWDERSPCWQTVECSRVSAVRVVQC